MIYWNATAWAGLPAKPSCRVALPLGGAIRLRAENGLQPPSNPACKTRIGVATPTERKVTGPSDRRRYFHVHFLNV